MMPNAEAALYALLSRLLAAEINADLVADLRSPDIREIFDKIEPGSLDDFDQDAAAAEYCRLFVLPRGVPAVAAAWLPSSDPNNSAGIVGLVHNLQSALGLSLPDGLQPDHAGTLLSIMAWLMENQPAAAIEFQTAALDPWITKFATALREQGELPIYRVTAEILSSLHAQSETE